MRQVYLTQNKVISRSLFSIDVQNLHFPPKTTLISKKNLSLSIGYIMLNFVLKLKCRQGGPVMVPL